MKEGRIGKFGEIGNKQEEGIKEKIGNVQEKKTRLSSIVSQPKKVVFVVVVDVVFIFVCVVVLIVVVVFVAVLVVLVFIVVVIVGPNLNLKFR